ncbi:MAG: cytochrome c oxidase subunit 4 [Actinomycetes bacterium]
MNLGGRLFAYGCVFYFVVAGIYGYMSNDPVGTTALALTGGLAFLVAFYVLFTSKRVGPLPEDNENAEISDADTEYGFFSPHSWWPLVIGVSTMLFVLGFVFAAWLALLGVIALLFGVFGLVYEYYRGDFAN